MQGVYYSSLNFEFKITSYLSDAIHTDEIIKL